MAFAQPFVAELPPLSIEENGTIRITGTRVTLDVLLRAYMSGESPEQIVEDFSALNVADVYAVIAYYLYNKSVLDAYLAHREAEALELRAEMEATHPTKHLKALLLERKAKAHQ